MIHPHSKGMALEIGTDPEIGPPMTNYLDETNQLLGMVGCHSAAEEGHRTISLVEDCTKTSPERAIVNDEALVKVRQL